MNGLYSKENNYPIVHTLSQRNFKKAMSKSVGKGT